MRNLKNNFSARESGLLFSLSFIAFNAVLIVFQLINKIHPIAGNFYISLGLIDAAIFFTCFIYCKITGINFFKAISIGAKPRAGFLISAAAIGICMLYVLSIPSYYFVELLKSLGYVPFEDGIEISTWLDFVLSTLFIAILPAVFEEILFRGVVLQGLRQFGDIFAVLVSSALFMLMHTNPSQTLFPFLSGIVLGFVFIKTGDLKYCMIIHFLNNFQSVAIQFFINYFDIPYREETALTVADFSFALFAAVIFAVCMIYLYKQKTKTNSENFVSVYRAEGVLYPWLVYSAAEAVNKTEVFENSENPVPNAMGNIYGGAAELMRNGYIYDEESGVFFLRKNEGNIIPPPQGYADEHNFIKNGKNVTKLKFFLYALTGIVLSAGLWFSVFFNI
jgi:membrane protease YdiL (CAAX protease family)